jgi:hypothetical protein
MPDLKILVETAMRLLGRSAKTPNQIPHLAAMASWAFNEHDAANFGLAFLK